MGIPECVCRVIEELMRKWKTRLEVWVNGKKGISGWVKIKTGFLQGDSYSAVGFCLTEVPVCVLLSKIKGYKMGDPVDRPIKRRHCLFIDDLKVFRESHRRLQAVNEVTVKTSNDTEAWYGVKKCAETVFIRAKWLKVEGLEVLQERMK